MGCLRLLTCQTSSVLPKLIVLMSYLSRLLGSVEDGDEHRLELVLGYGHGDAEEGVERVGLPLAPGTRQRRPELRLEHGVHEAVVAAHVVGQRLRRHYVVRTTERVLKQYNN